MARALLGIFSTQGAPIVLQSDNGREFVNEVLEALKLLWPGLQIIHGRPRHPQSQGSVERSNADVANMLGQWMADNNSTDWALGCNIVAFQKNTRHHRAINAIPYHLVYGQKVRLGIRESALIPPNILNRITNEEELAAHLRINLDFDDIDLDAVFYPPEAIENTPVLGDDVNFAAPTDVNATAPVDVNPTTPTDVNATAPVDVNATAPTDINPTAPTDINPTAPVDVNPTTPVDVNATAPVDVNPTAPVDVISVISPEPGCDLLYYTQDDQLNAPNTPTRSANKRNIPAYDTPNRGALRQTAMGSLEKQADMIKKKFKAHAGPLAVGTVCLLKVPQVDRSKTDPSSVPVVVVKTVSHDFHTVVCKGGVLNTNYGRESLLIQENQTPELHELGEAFKNWETMPRISVRQAVASISLTGGQGFQKCNCAGNCTKNTCSCQKAKVLCNSRCHAGNTCCLNNKAR